MIEKVDSSNYVFIDNKHINTFAELVETNALKGKRIFIDLCSVYNGKLLNADLPRSEKIDDLENVLSNFFFK
jgi:hypothetical protein